MMNEKELFSLALGLSGPWEIRDIRFSVKENRLDIEIDFRKGSKFTCPSCGKKDCNAYDTEETVWRHLNFFQHKTYLHARRPRIDCEDCGVKTVKVPWGRQGSGFTYLFESFVMILAREMSVSAISRILNEHDTRIWRILRHYVDEARKREDLYGVTKVGVDETARARGHDYVTVFVDMDKSRVIYVTKGKDSTTFACFNQDLYDHGGDSHYVTEISCDMSPAFIDGAYQFFVNANVTFDKFHVMKFINEAVDKVRKQEQKERPELKKTKYIWLKNPVNLTNKQREQFDSLSELNLMTAKAYQIKLNFQEFWNQSVDNAEEFLKNWCLWANDSNLEPIQS